MKRAAISWHTDSSDYTCLHSPSTLLPNVYQLNRIPFALLRFRMFRPVRVRNLDRKPCLLFTTRKVALLVGLLDLCLTCDPTEVTAGPRVDAGEGMMEGDWKMREHELPLTSGRGDIGKWYDRYSEGGRRIGH